MHWQFTVQVQTQILALFTAPSAMLLNLMFITTDLLQKFSLLILCCVHSPMLLFVLEIYTAVQAHTLEARDLCYRVQFHRLGLLRSVIIETQFWIWCHYYDHRWLLVWSLQNMLAKCSLIIFHIYQHCSFNSKYKEKKILHWIMMLVTYPLLCMLITKKCLQLWYHDR